MPVRLNFVVEGPTERRFVENILRPHLADRSIWVTARCVETSRSRGRKYSGGIRDYTKAKRDIERWMNEDQNPDARFTTMFDLYALPGDFPGYEDARQEHDPYARVRLLEDALGEDISDQRFVPYLQLHEFEALLFCDPQKLEERFYRHSAGIGRLAQAAEQSNPELINDGNETAPSKRIIREIPEYESDKASSGPTVAERIGLPTLRMKCQHFAEWINKLEALTQSPQAGGGGTEMTTDTSEKGLETLICTVLTGFAHDPAPKGVIQERPADYSPGWIPGDPQDYDREHCVDLAQLSAFLHETQPDVAPSLDLGEDNPARRRFLARLQGEIARPGTIDVLRQGVKHGPHSIDLFYGTPSPGNVKASVLYSQNRFSVTRQLRYSMDNAQLALDLCLFINGLPVATFELKNSLTKQMVDGAVEQYKRGRNPREKLFEFGRCLVHFAVDDHEVRFCTHLRGKDSWFLPFNKGWNDGRGNPPNPNGLKTDYLWKEVLTRDGLTNIIESYAQIVETKDDKTGRKRRTQIWPRYHQLDVVRKLLADVSCRGAGTRYLVQHSAGSGKSNSIAWLAHQIIGLESNGASIFDSVLIVTDRRILDKQIRDTIRQFAQVRSVVGHAETSGHLRTLLREGKKIVITTIQKFPFILDAIGDEHRGRRFAIIIDEAHSSQGGRASASVSAALGEAGTDEDEEDTTEDKINRLMESRKLLTNASYFAFTATPKNKTLEIFGAPEPEGEKITDSIVSQLRAGHPDTAMGTVRQLLELAMAVKIIAIDRTGETAKRYQDFDEANYLHKSVQHRSAPREDNFVRLSEIKREYGLERIPGQFAWILTSDGSRLRSMEQVIEFVAQHYDGEQTGQRFRYNQYMLLWEVLNKWGHMSRSASRRKLGTRSSEGYLREHLVEKSSVGLDAPLSLAILLLDSTLSTLAYIAFDLTGNEHNAELQPLGQLMKDIDASIDDVEPELLANDF